MKQIYFIRHSLKDRSTTLPDAPLSPEGHALAQLLPGLFKTIAIDAIYSSPYLRSLETIQPIATEKKLPLIIVDDLKERVVGRKNLKPADFSQKQWDDFDYKLPEGESLHEVANRLINATTNILKEDGTHFIVGGHSTAFAILFHELTNGKFGVNDYTEMPSPAVYLGTFDQDTLVSLAPIPIL